jgi:cell division septum initiation protein DivIVA
MPSATGTGRIDERDGRYDIDRLERSVEFLIREHERLSAEREALLGELIEREHRIATLESRLASERATRAGAVESVDKILSRLAQLQASVPARMGSIR